jgi:hypothetical protein
MSESGSATLSAVSDNADGTYTATITNSTAEKVTVTTAFGGSNVDDTVDINFIKSKVFDLRSGIVTTVYSTLTASPTSVVADGTSTSTITMQAKDVATPAGESEISDVIKFTSAVSPTLEPPKVALTVIFSTVL